MAYAYSEATVATLYPAAATDHLTVKVVDNGPFVVDMPGYSNGFAYVRDKHGNEVATCYGSPAVAIAVAYALNFMLAAMQREEQARNKEAA